MKRLVVKRPNKEDSIMKKRRLVCVLIMALMFGLTGFASQSEARANVSVNIDLPPYIFGAPPPLVVIPGTYAYFAPEADIDIIFYKGYWFRYHKLRWYRARNYNGPWTFIVPSRLPQGLIDLPTDYRLRYREHPRIAYPDFHRNWRHWEKTRHWEKEERWREDRRREMREEKRERKREERREHRQEERRDHRQEHRGR